jgi:hypothetical protein
VGNLFKTFWGRLLDDSFVCVVQSSDSAGLAYAMIPYARRLATASAAAMGTAKIKGVPNTPPNISERNVVGSNVTADTDTCGNTKNDDDDDDCSESRDSIPGNGTTDVVDDDDVIAMLVMNGLLAIRA